MSTPVASPKLDGVDAMWIDDADELPMPAAQLDRTPVQNDGVDAVKLPTLVYKLPIGATPVGR